MAKKKEQKDMAQEQELRLKFQQKLIEILELGKKKKNMLEYQEIADFFKDLNLDHDNVNRGIELRVTDPELLSVTGGIVQGMSGAPIIQKGKFVGAVTHVLVQDSTRGYGIFIENMLE